MLARAEAPLNAEPDAELVERLRAGDERGVEELVSRYAGFVYRVALRLTGSREDAEEVTWDVMFTVSRKISTFRGDAALSTWIYRVAANAAYGTRQGRAASSVPLEDTLLGIDHSNGGVDGFRDWSAFCEDPAVQAELRGVLEAAIAELPPEYRVVVVFHDVEGFSNAEAAELLGLSLAAVKSRVHRARLTLRARLARYFERDGKRGPSVSRGS